MMTEPDLSARNRRVIVRGLPVVLVLIVGWAGPISADSTGNKAPDLGPDLWVDAGHRLGMINPLIYGMNFAKEMLAQPPQAVGPSALRLNFRRPPSPCS